MSDNTSIQWTDATWNPTRGCTKIAQGCKNCYAETFAERFRGVKGHPYERGFEPREAPDQLTVPLHWKKPRRIFVDSMSDLFHEAFSFDYIALCFNIMAKCPQHTFQILTKRPSRAAEFCASPANVWMPLPNVWIGTSIANQDDAGENIFELLKVRARIRFVSAEPLIAPVSFRWLCAWPENAPTTAMNPNNNGTTNEYGGLRRLDWVIVGGESGPRSRPCQVEWIRSIVSECKAADVPVFVKQLGAKPYVLSVAEWEHIGHLRRDESGERLDVKLSDRKGGDPSEWPIDLRIREFPKDQQR